MAEEDVKQSREGKLCDFRNCRQISAISAVWLEITASKSSLVQSIMSHIDDMLKSEIMKIFRLINQYHGQLNS